MPQITRVEIALAEDGTIRGAQASLDNGRVIGVNTGKNPEYDTPLADVLGDVLSAAMAHVADRDAKITDAQVLLDRSISRISELEKSNGELQARIDATQSTPAMSPDRMQAGLAALGFTKQQVDAFFSASA